MSKELMISKLNNEEASLIIGEIGQNHDGSLGMAHAYIDALADAGVDAVKFQTHIASEESTEDDQFRVNFSYQDASRFDYWKRMEFSESQWLELKRHADQRGLGFLSTPFSGAAVQLLSRIGIEAWKIGSGDTKSEEIINPIIHSKKPVIISSGMSSWKELDEIVDKMNDSSTSFSLMQCTSKYPTPLSDVGLNVLTEMKNRYKCRIGISDHSGNLSPALVALARGYLLVEIHATFDKSMFGPDVTSSLTISEIKRLSDFAHDLRLMNDSPVDKDEMAIQLQHQKKLFCRSIALVKDFPAGHVLSVDDLTLKKPGSGLKWSDRHLLIGRKLKYDMSSNRLLHTGDVS